MIAPRIFPSIAHPQEFPNQTQAGSLATAEFIVIYLVPRELKGLRVLKGISWKTLDEVNKNLACSQGNIKKHACA